MLGLFHAQIKFLSGVPMLNPHQATPAATPLRGNPTMPGQSDLRFAICAG